MNKQIKFIIFSFIFILGCNSEPVLSPEEFAELNEVGIFLEMDASLNLSIKTKNFPEEVGILGFEIMYNPNAITYENYLAGDHTVTWASESITNEASFLFVGDIEKDSKLLTLSFSGSKSSYKQTTIYLNNVAMYDADGAELIWDDFTYSSVCYINEHPTNGEEYEEYSWRTDFCFPLNYEPTEVNP